MLLRTLQRRVREWRSKIIVAFDDGVVQEDMLVGQELPAPLRTMTVPAVETKGVTTLPVG